LSEAKPTIGPLARKDGDPVFDEPWQAEVLALAYALSHHGVFSLQAWSDSLGAELRRADERGEPDNQDTYYQAALAVLEALLGQDGRISTDAVERRVDQWRDAYLHTPHGKPVELAPAKHHDCDPGTPREA
jgi:nitrile hydratase accessory protein